jgi:cytoskeletal protein RodZ
MAQDPRYNRSYQTPYESDHASYDNQYAEPVDLDAFGSQLRTQHPARSIATREEFLPDDSVPLFLSGSDEEVRSSKFGRRRKSGSRLLKTGAFAAAALIATFVAVKNPFTVFANATASLISAADNMRSAQAPAAPPRQAASAAVASTPAMVAGPALATAAALPSRDEIAVALRTAHQNQAPEVQQPAAAVVATAAAPTVAVAPTPVAPAAPAAPAARRMDSEELANLMTRAKALLASGDISPARLLLERAAQAQEASAALMLAQTYDPTVLGTQDIRNITPDPAMARTWYQRAAQLGSADAQRRLSQLQ